MFMVVGVDIVKITLLNIFKIFYYIHVSIVCVCVCKHTCISQNVCYVGHRAAFGNWFCFCYIGFRDQHTWQQVHLTAQPSYQTKKDIFEISEL